MNGNTDKNQNHRPEHGSGDERRLPPTSDHKPEHDHDGDHGPGLLLRGTTELPHGHTASLLGQLHPEHRSAGESVSQRVAARTHPSRYPACMDMYFDIVVGPDGTLQLPEAILAGRHWAEGTVITAMATAHGVILNERAELERLVESRMEGLDPIAAYIKELQRRNDNA